MKKSTLFLGLVKLSALAALSAGCSASAEDVATPADEAVATTTQTLTVKNPRGTYFADITGIGKGCKKDTWIADISPDGETFTVLFSEYEAAVAAGEKVATSNCQLMIRLRSPQGLQYSVGSFFYTGEAYLDTPGMQAEQRATYYFQGNPVDSSKGRSVLRGPTNVDHNGSPQIMSYVYEDEIGLPDLVWSPCGADRRLNVQTSVNITNNEAQTGNGFINTISVDGSLRLVFRLYWRTC